MNDPEGQADGRDTPRGTSILDFGSLYEAHAAGVRRFALYLCGDPTLADDIVSETFIRVWHARERLDLTTVRAYLCAIARNLFLQNRHRGERHVPLNESLPDAGPDPAERAGARRELRVVLAALQQLPEVDRAALLMRASEGLSYQEIAAALRISVTAAKVKVHRARLRLAETRSAATDTSKEMHR